MDESGLVRTDLGVFLDLHAVDASLPAYRRLFLALRRSILARHIRGGTRLPSTRSLSDALGISRNTVKSAYELLQAEGYLVSRQGAGCFVEQLPEPESETPGGGREREELPSAQATSNRAVSRSPGLLQPGVPALDRFPYRRWQRALQSSVCSTALRGGDPQGDLRLREEIVRWLGAQRGMQADASQVVITSGSQQGLYLVACQLVGPQHRVLLEQPGFQGIERAFRAAGADVGYFWSQDLERVDALESASLLVVTPSRNFPLGHTLAADKRLALLRWAYENDVWLIEDDYDSEFAAGPALSAMYSLDSHQRVIYAGTFSRTMFQGLRLGYLVLPSDLVGQFVEARRIMDGGLSTPVQMALAEFMACGDYSRHLRRMKRVYLQRRLVMEALLAQSALSHLRIIDAGGGMHLCLELPPDSDDEVLVGRLESEGVRVRPLSQYGLCGGGGLVLGFAAEDEVSMARGITLLESVLRPALDE